jgi:hypothetical protein
MKKYTVALILFVSVIVLFIYFTVDNLEGFREGAKKNKPKKKTPKPKNIKYITKKPTNNK